MHSLPKEKDLTASTFKNDSIPIPIKAKTEDNHLLRMASKNSFVEL